MAITNIARPKDAADDEALAEAARINGVAFEILYRRYVTRVYRYCCSRVDNVQTAEDVTAETFLAALEGIAGYERRGSFAAWLFGIAANQCRAYYRHRHRHPQTALQEALRVPDATAPDPAQTAYRQGVLDCARRALALLSEDRQEVVRLRFLAGLNTAETAAVMGRRPGAVRTLLSRAIEELRERCLDEQE